MSAAAVDFESSHDFRAMLCEVVMQSASEDRERVIQSALSRLDLAVRDELLEVGCGRGDILVQAAARTSRGSVMGIDPSTLMLRHAYARNRRWIAQGRAAVCQGRTEDLSGLPAERFSKVLGVHVVYFWRAPIATLLQIRRVLKPKGRIVLGFRSLECDAQRGSASRVRVAETQVAAWLEAAGFELERSARSLAPAAPLAWCSARRA